MSELRQNLATKEWVVIAPERGKKPHALKSEVAGGPVPVSEYDIDCPFCPGNEERFPDVERHRLEDGGRRGGD